MRSYLLPALLFLGSAFAAPVEVKERDFPDLRTVFASSRAAWSPDTIISFYGSEEFENATSRWTIAGEPSFSAAITPATEADVVQAVKLATTFNIPFLATGKRHGFTQSWDDLEDGLAIDLALLGWYEIDAENGLVTIGGSAGMGDFQADLDAAGWMIQGGSGGCPGYLGLALGGGVGRFMGLFGLVHDAWVSARVVTAAGEIVTVSDTENEDLWWALRGAGANFGIVTEATFQAHRKADYDNGFVLNADIIYPPEKTAEYFQYLASLEGQLPRNVGIIHIASYNATTGTSQLLANWVWIGPEAEGREYLQQFIDIGPTEVQFYEYITWSELIATSIGGFGAELLCIKKQYRDFYTVNIRRYDAAIWQHAFETLSQWYVDQPEARLSFMNIEVFPNQRTAEYGHDYTSYPWRDTLAYIQVGIQTDDPYAYTIRDAGNLMAEDLRASWHAHSGFDGEGAIYVNYAHGDESIETVYGKDKLPKLAALKREWDPNNHFGHNNPIPTHYGSCPSHNH